MAVAVGNAVKVTAIDSQTGIEVSAMGPARAAQADLERLALAALRDEGLVYARPGVGTLNRK